MFTRTLALSLLVLAACGSARPVYRGPVRVASPALVAIEPDVKVVADADKPVFHAAGHYYLFHDGRWWRSRVLAGPWTLDPKPPVPVRQIDQPFSFTHYAKEHPIDRPAPTAVAKQPARPVPKAKPLAQPNQPESERTARGPSAVDPTVDPTLNAFPR